MNKTFLNPDLHLHSVFSDGTDTPTELIAKVRNAGVDIFSLTDHDSFLGSVEIKKIISDGDPFFVPGAELSCKDGFGKYHILAYNCDFDKKAIRETLEYTHNLRKKKSQNRINFIKDQFGFVLSDEDIKSVMSQTNPGKPHIARKMIARGYAKTMTEAIDYINQYNGDETPITPAEAIDAISRSCGIPVLAHGILADGSDALTDKEIETRVQRLKSSGLAGLECFYSTFTEKQKQTMLALAEKYGLLVTAGSDYHGINKSICIGQTNSPEYEVMAGFYSLVLN